MPEAVGNDRWLWLGGSFLVAVAAGQLASWLSREDDLPPRVTALLEWQYASVLFHLLRFLFYVGIPFAALLWGRDAIIGRLLGLQPVALLSGLGSGSFDAAEIAANGADWARDLGWAVGLGSGTWLVLAIGWLTVGKAADMPTPPGALLREAVFHEVHWAFYRNAPVLALGPYWGTWAGLGIVTAEALANPGWRRTLGSRDRAPVALMRVAMAVFSAVLFIHTQNLWLAVLTHWAVTWGLSHWMLAGDT